LELVTSDALSYLNGVPDATFDAVASGWTIHNFEETYREQVLKEIYRVLKPNGVFVNGDKYAQDDKDKHLADFNWSIEQFIENMSKKGHQDICYEWILHMSYDESKGILMKEGESLSLLNEVGFVNPKIIWRKHMEAVLITRK
jgi:ubiquinone/menaquinone biosynthesis C-methylase UbiE